MGKDSRPKIDEDGMPIANQFFILLLFFHHLVVTKLGCSDIHRIPQQKDFLQKYWITIYRTHRTNWLILYIYYFIVQCCTDVLATLSHPILSSAPISVLHNSRTRLALAPAGCCFQAFFLSLRHFLYKSNVNNIMIRLSSINQTITAVFQIQFFYVSSVSPVVSSSTLINSMAQKFSFCGSCKKIIKTNY